MFHEIFRILDCLECLVEGWQCPENVTDNCPVTVSLCQV